ncbi:inorganic phosphate transporter [Psychrobacter sanguinis]|uniref:inorganic phosphate transporter n=1 Tax=Psychrobacter sanguinis TaxID=861445 RepID=UPI00020C7966|nr:inorganic phosphate transporter [Psychrobacter sanguinis]EGK14940.1 phosphate transporter [Psychrobacter sp. 1501(2011)]MCD9151054.1 inorganic phosphate transporter [Psychrobacter sanguinis]
MLPKSTTPSGTHFKGSGKANLIFGLFLVVITAYFIWWGLDYTNHQQVLLFIVATLFGIFMAFNIGGNDVANSFGTSVGAGTLTIPQALAVAAIFEVSGAVIAGGEVTDTIRKGIVDLDALGPAVTPNLFIYVMLSALIAAAFWLLFATKKGLPVSTTHSIIGGVVGSSVVMGIQIGGTETALSTVQWSQVGEIAISWVLSPLLGGCLAYFLYGQIKSNILSYNDRAEERVKELKAAKKALKKRHKEWLNELAESLQISYTSKMVRDQEIYKDEDTERDDLETDYYQELFDIERERDSIDTLKALRNWVPLIAAFGGVVMTAMVVFKGLSNVNMTLTSLHGFLLMIMIGALIWLTTYIYTKSIKGKQKEDLTRATFILFSWMQVFTAAGFAFSHGANDIANAVGPFAAIMDVIRTNTIASEAAVPAPVMITFGVALIVGLWFIGKEVIQTVGTNLAEMHPASGFSAELSAATVVMGASMMGLPVSSTHVLVGAVLGIGMVNKNTNWGLMKPIGLAWVITLPAAATMSMISYLILTNIF